MADVQNSITCSVFSCEKIYNAQINLSKLKHSSRFGVYLAVSGSGLHRVLDQEIPCTQGDICIIPPNVPHGFFLTEKNDKLTIRQLEFDIEEWFSGAVTEKGDPDYCYGVLNDNGVIAYATLNAYMQERIHLLYDYIEAEVLEKKQGWQELIRGYLANLFVSISRYINSAIKNSFSISVKEWTIVSAAMDIIKEQYADGDLTLDRIARNFYISQSQLSRIFEKTTGVTFSNYLRSIRINNACELLKSSDLNVADVAKDCGFRDMNTFYKVFGDTVGMTPKKYKQSLSPSNSKTIKNTNKTNLKKEKIMVILSEISENLQKGKAKIVKEMVQQAIDEGADPEQILNEGLLAGMSVIGEKFKNNEVYVPEVLVAARAMNMGAQILKPHLAANGVVATGKVCIGTVQGDLHDIGKNLVKMMMEGKGLEVVDLGTDVAPEAFVQTAMEQNCQVICCSALLTTTMGVMEDVVKAAEAAGIRDKVKIMIGGAPISQEYCDKIGADCYTVDAASAADAAVEFCK